MAGVERGAGEDKRIADHGTSGWGARRPRAALVTTGDQLPPLLRNKAYRDPSVFTAANLLREARRQRKLGQRPVPTVCLLDPDGDVVRHLAATGQAQRHEDWACYHSELWLTRFADKEIGIVPCAVGGPYAVLVAEELTHSGCELIISVTSAGTITPLDQPPYFVIIERALRDEGTSLHYLPPGDWAELAGDLHRRLAGAFDHLDEPVHHGASWTTDAPFRETVQAIAAANAEGIHAVEMEAASLYAYARAERRRIVCVAHVTNTMAVDGDDFEKGEANGTYRILDLTTAIADRLHDPTTP